MKEISLKQVTVSDEEILKKDLGHKIIFNDDFIECISEGEWSMWDDSLGMMCERHFKNNKCIHRSDISCIELYIHTTTGNYVVEWGSYRVVFEKKKDAETLYTQMRDWAFFKIIPL